MQMGRTDIDNLRSVSVVPLRESEEYPESDYAARHADAVDALRRCDPAYQLDAPMWGCKVARLDSALACSMDADLQPALVASLLALIKAAHVSSDPACRMHAVAFSATFAHQWAEEQS
jgi:hypothetical protein